MPTRTLLVLAVLAGCGPIKLGGEVDSGDTGGRQGDGETGETGETGDPLAGERPVVTGVQFATCGPDVDGLDTWTMSCLVTDPQGEETLAFGYVEIWNKGEVAGSQHAMVCTTDGTCQSGWKAESGEACATRGLTLVIVAKDNEGNESAPYEYAYTP